MKRLLTSFKGRISKFKEMCQENEKTVLDSEKEKETLREQLDFLKEEICKYKKENLELMKKLNEEDTNKEQRKINEEHRPHIVTRLIEPLPLKISKIGDRTSRKQKKNNLDLPPVLNQFCAPIGKRKLEVPKFPPKLLRMEFKTKDTKEDNCVKIPSQEEKENIGSSSSALQTKLDASIEKSKSKQTVSDDHFVTPQPRCSRCSRRHRIFKGLQSKVC